MKRLLVALLLATAAFVAVPATVAVAQTEAPAESGQSGTPEATEHEYANHAAEECAHLLEEGKTPDDCQEAPSLIMPATNELIFGALSFFVVFGLLAKFAYPAIKNMMEARTNRIRESIDDADRAKNEAQSILDEYQRQLADARNESNRIIEEARQTADQLRRDLVARAEQEALELRQRTQEDIGAAQQRAMADLQAQIRDLTIELAEKIVQRQLDRDTNRALIDNYIAELERS